MQQQGGGQQAKAQDRKEVHVLEMEDSTAVHRPVRLPMAVDSRGQQQGVTGRGKLVEMTSHMQKGAMMEH